jgi:RNA binding activity-knot of a chromodomain
VQWQVLEVEVVGDNEARRYFVHFDGWNKRFDEWISSDSVISTADHEVSKRRGRKSTTVSCYLFD